MPLSGLTNKAVEDQARNNLPFSVALDAVEPAWLGILHGETVIVFGSMSWSRAALRNLFQDNS
jgi:hypothetical protein